VEAPVKLEKTLTKPAAVSDEIKPLSDKITNKNLSKV